MEEADEATFWVEFSTDIGVLTIEQARPLLSESSQFVAILTRTLKTAKKRQRIFNDLFEQYSNSI